MKISLGWLILIVISLTSCGDTPNMNWFPQIWATDADSQSIVRIKDLNVSGMSDEQIIQKIRLMASRQEGEIEKIPTSDPRFNDFVCVYKDEPRKAVDAYQKAINKCKVWEP